MAEVIDTTEHCLLKTLQSAIDLIEQEEFSHCEPGQYRIVEVLKCDQT